MPTSQDNTLPKGPRPFTDREDKINKFYSLFYYLAERDYNVLSFHGVGGVGKSRLREELINQLHNGPWANDTVYSKVLDFDTRDNRPPLRSIERALYALRNELRQKGVIFRTFDIAYAHYWEKAHPEVALQQKQIPFINNASAITDLFGGAKEFIPALKDFASWVDGAGLLPKVLTLIVEVGKAGKKWITVREVEKLRELNGMNVGQLLNNLYYFLALDIRSYQKEKDKRLVFFLDTYEALWLDAPHLSVDDWLTRDEWIRNLIAELPNTLWVITGKNQLRWQELNDWSDDDVDEMLVEELSNADSETYLVGCNITDSEIVGRIIDSSRGLPFALELQVDQYELIIRTRQPTINDFSERPNRLVQRFTEYLELQERETLKVLSCARGWDLPIFTSLITYFHTGYPATALTELSRFAFIQKEGDQYRMHNLMREELYKRLTVEVRGNCHQFLFEYYNEKLNPFESKNVSFEQEFAFEEALYHKLFIGTIEQTTNWYKDQWRNWESSTRWSLCLRLLLEIKYIWESTPKFQENEAYYELIEISGSLFFKLGQYETSLKCYEQVLKFYRHKFDKQHSKIGSLLFATGVVFRSLGKYKEALESHKQALEISLKNKGEQHVSTSLILESIGNVYFSNGEYKEALDYLLRALDIKHTLFGTNDRRIAGTLSNIGNVYYKKGPFTTSLDYHQQALIINHTVLGCQHPDTAKALSAVGNDYRKLGDNEEALEHQRQALSINKAILGDQHPDTAMALNNVGQSYLDLGQYDNAMRYCQESLEIKLNILGYQHPSTAHSFNSVGLVHEKLDQLDAALLCFRRALQIRRKLMNKSHLDTAASLENIGNIFERLKKYCRSLFFYEQALTIYKNVLDESDSLIIEFQMKAEELRAKL